MKYEPLFEQFRLNESLALPNRLVMAPMTTTSGEEDGSFSKQEIAYLARRAETACYCHKSGHSFERQVGCHSDAMLPALTRCAQAINERGAASFLQIHHGGNAAKERFSGQQPVAPSAVHNRRGTSELPRALTEGEIEEIIIAFAASARRAQQAGFTGIELHGANTYLFQQFFSPFTNKRTDKWGCQNWENRCRFASEVVRSLRESVGPDYPISYRVSPEEEEPDGYSTYDAIELLERLVALGVEIVHVSSWEYGTGLRNDWPTGSHPTKLIRDKLQIPVIGVGKIRHPDQALRVLDDGVGLVAMGRELLFDADWATKVRSGDIESIKMKVESKDEIKSLEIPERMVPYVERFWPDRI